MKRKHYAVCCMVIILISLVAVALRFPRDLDKSGRGRYAIAFRPPVTVPVPDPETVREMEQLQAIMHQLVRPPASDLSPVRLALFGYKPVEEGLGRESVKGYFLPPEMNYTLTLAFRAGTKRFCVIDGQFYEQGATLPDGGEIQKIEQNRVLIKKHDFTHSIFVRNHAGPIDNHEVQSGEKK